VGVWEHTVDSELKQAQSRNQYKRSKNTFSIALTLVPLGTKLLELPAQFLVGSPGTSPVSSGRDIDKFRLLRVRVPGPVSS